ncbi:hypothetical protein SEPCBS57363_001280 [Sporothrix epigloea]|uniref:Xylanolytic transcriptional activator regulatory domain-containing protein n=1 Tax=Sporothrix epigloea TaxID=1892477 RepID=A0ABP0D9N7_9PEZI
MLITDVPVSASFFPTRGAPDMDREYRHPRMKGDKVRKINAGEYQPRLSGSGVVLSSLGAPISSTAGGAMTGISSDPWDMLPPLEQVIDAVTTFTSQYFQLGFIPRHTFLLQLREQPRSISLFLLLSLLSVSGRMTPTLVEAYGGPDSTAELFMDRASTIALTELYQEPTLSRCQAFYLLSLAQQGSGYRNRSYVNLGIALRMAILMKLHREETYNLDDRENTPAIIQHSESARRTLWMLYSQDNLHADPLAPTSLSESDITTLLPSSEEDFDSGTCPAVRTALEDITPTPSKSGLADPPNRSLFASLMQSHQLWGRVLRRTIKKNSGKQPWDANSEYATIKKKLDEWEKSLPAEHLWSPSLLREHKAKGVDLIDCWVQEQAPGDGTGAQLAVFCVYSCAFMAAYLCKYPKLCPNTATLCDGKFMLDRTMDVLKRSTNVWPLARRWIDSVEKFIAVEATNLIVVQSNSHEGGMAEGRDPIPSALHPPLAHLAPSGPSNNPFDDRRQLARQLGPDNPHVRPLGGIMSSSIGVCNQAPIHLPQPRIDASMINSFNSHMRLPPPQLPHNTGSKITEAAAHYAPPPTSLSAPLNRPQLAPQRSQNGQGDLMTPGNFDTQAQIHQNDRQSSPHQDIVSVVHSRGDTAGVGANIGYLLAPVQTDDTLSLPQLPPMPLTTLPLENLMVRRIGSNPMMTTTDQQPHQQEHESLYPIHRESDQVHGMHVDLLDGSSMPLMETDIIYDPEQMAYLLVPDDGYQNELQAWAQGPGLQAGASWASSVYSF